MDKKLKNLEKIKILLLENISSTAIKEFNRWNLTNITTLETSPTIKELKKLITEYHVIGLRSRTHIDKNLLNLPHKLSAIGCFCIGTNQVDIRSSKQLGIPVFNAPYSNTRSVAELAICEIIALLRKIPIKIIQMHTGIWDKSAVNCYEIRGKSLGIIGYGHIGKQLGFLAEALGMHVQYYDISPQLSFGNAKAIYSLNELLATSDVVSLHVPESTSNENMFTTNQFRLMKKGSYFINLSRGSLVKLDDLAHVLSNKHLSGAALDVFAVEPSSNNDRFDNIFAGLQNVILTPHIAGSTEEAQKNIGQEVANKLANFITTGSTMEAINFAKITVPNVQNAIRFVHVHKNIPGMMSRINKVFEGFSVNIAGQYLQTDNDIGYTVIDTAIMPEEMYITIKQELRDIPYTIKAYTIS